MEKYDKPCIVSQTNIQGVIPLAGLSAAGLAGVASVAGLAVGMAFGSSKGSSDIIPYRVSVALQE